MIIGDTYRGSHHHHILPYPPEPFATSETNYTAVLTSLRHQLLSSEHDHVPADSGEEFFMYEFKIRMCTRPAGHDWTECPFAHSSEKARRRDPRKLTYSGESCPEFRKGVCKKGDSCELAHGVFEIWLHPTMFRTRICKDGSGCSRRVCFFAHSPTQLRIGEVNLLAGRIRVGPPGFESPMLSVGKLGRIQKEELVMERVESGRWVRARMFEKLSIENSFGGCGSGSTEVSGLGPDLGWVSDLIT